MGSCCCLRPEKNLKGWGQEGFPHSNKCLLVSAVCRAMPFGVVALHPVGLESQFSGESSGLSLNSACTCLHQSCWNRVNWHFRWSSSVESWNSPNFKLLNLQGQVIAPWTRWSKTASSQTAFMFKTEPHPLSSDSLLEPYNRLLRNSRTSLEVHTLKTIWNIFNLFYT